MLRYVGGSTCDGSRRLKQSTQPNTAPKSSWSNGICNEYKQHATLREWLRRRRSSRSGTIHTTQHATCIKLSERTVCWPQATLYTEWMSLFANTIAGEAIHTKQSGACVKMLKARLVGHKQHTALGERPRLQTTLQRRPSTQSNMLHMSKYSKA